MSFYMVANRSMYTNPFAEAWFVDMITKKGYAEMGGPRGTAAHVAEERSPALHGYSSGHPWDRLILAGPQFKR